MPGTSFKGKIALFFLAIMWLSCGPPVNEEKQKTLSSPTDSLVESSNNAQPEKQASRYQTQLDTALNDPSIDPYFKAVYHKGRLVQADDDKMLSIVDSLFSKDPGKILFYFLVFTKSMNGADGFYSEPVGLAAVDFVTTNTERFADYFNIGPDLTDQDLRNWAMMICGELQISREGEELEAINELEYNLHQNLKGNRKEYTVIIDSLINYIREVFTDRQST